MGRFGSLGNCESFTASMTCMGFLFALSAVLLGIIGALVKDRMFIFEAFWGLGLIAYIRLAIATQQFTWIGTSFDLLHNVVWLIPLILGGLVLPRKDYWLAGIGCWFVLLAGTTALTYSTLDNGGVVGLWTRIRF